MYELTQEQQAIVDEIVNPTSDVLSIAATAGSSKSYTICKSIETITDVKPGTICQVLMFNKAPADELQTAIGAIAIISTLHALAYSYVVKQYGLNRNIATFLNWRDIPRSVARPFGTDHITLGHIEEFCASEYLTVDDYFANTEEPVNIRIQRTARQLLNLMAKGHMRITHSFYLKFFHTKVMSGEIELKPVDLLIIDEVQDSSAITLDIFAKTPASHRVLVGDDSQMIYHFLNLEDGFLRYPHAKRLTLSKSFRVSSIYAAGIQDFLRTHLQNDEYVFEGMDYPAEQKIVTEAYLTRTNSALIGKMIELNKTNTPYKLSSKAKLSGLFKLPLALCYAKPGFDQKDPELVHLQSDINSWGKLPVHSRDSKFKFLLEANPGDANLKRAINLISKFSPEDIIAANDKAKSHKKAIANLTVATSFSVKGSTFDSVELDDDIDESIKDFIGLSKSQLIPEERAMLANYFVACTRHRLKLTNAKYLEELMEKQHA